METLATLCEKRANAALHARNEWEKELAAATAEKREPTAEARAAFDKAMAEHDAVDQTITRLQADEARSARLAQLGQPQPRRAVTPTPTGNGGVRVDEIPENRYLDAIRNHATSTPEYRAAFMDFVRFGTKCPLPAECRDLQTDTLAAGGATVMPLMFASGLLKFLDYEVIMRSLGTVMTVNKAESLGVVSLDTDPEDPDWTTEVGTTDNDTAMAFGKRELTPHKLSKLVKISNKLMGYSMLDIEGIVQQRLGYKVGTVEESNFMTGNGVKKPLGLFVASADGITTARDTTAAGATAITADDVAKVAYSLKQSYFNRSTWIFGRNALIQLRIAKTTNEYVWQPALGLDVPATVMGRPFKISEFAPNSVATGLYTMILGDMSYYWIADSIGMSLQRLSELYSLTDQTGYIIRKYTDGMPVLAEAFARLKQA